MPVGDFFTSFARHTQATPVGSSAPVKEAPKRLTWWGARSRAARSNGGSPTSQSAREFELDEMQAETSEQPNVQESSRASPKDRRAAAVGSPKGSPKSPKRESLMEGGKLARPKSASVEM